MGRQATGSSGERPLIHSNWQTLSVPVQEVREMLPYEMSKIPFWSGTYASRGSDALAGFQKRATGGSQFDGLQREPLVNRYKKKKRNQAIP